MKNTDNGDAQASIEDPHYFIMKGRRWRRTDPNIPASLLSELVKELMSARRDVGSGKRKDDQVAIRAARNRVQDAKVALGERGHKWWLDRDIVAMRERLASTIRTLLRHRGYDKTICPSDAARVCGNEYWRSLMDDTREVASNLADEGWLEITQKGKPVIPPIKGPIRLKQLENSDE